MKAPALDCYIIGCLTPGGQSPNYTWAVCRCWQCGDTEGYNGGCATSNGDAPLTEQTNHKTNLIICYNEGFCCHSHNPRLRWSLCHVWVYGFKYPCACNFWCGELIVFWCFFYNKNPEDFFYIIQDCGVQSTAGVWGTESPLGLWTN